MRFDVLGRIRRRLEAERLRGIATRGLLTSEEGRVQLREQLRREEGLTPGLTPTVTPNAPDDGGPDAPRMNT